MFYAIRLAKEGYYGGNPQSICSAPVDIVLNMLNFEKFEDDYASEHARINAVEAEE